MKLTLISESSDIIVIDPEDQWDLAEQGEMALQASGIRLDRSKDICFLAMAGDEVIGAVACGWNEDEFSFDVGIHPEKRDGYAGIKLIDAAIAKFDEEREAIGETAVMSLHVINPKLAEFLEYRRGFEVTHAGSNHYIAVRY